MKLIFRTRTAATKERLITLMFLLIIVAGITFFIFVNPATNKSYPKCPFRAITGAFCPG